jgi:hypothetical protein
VPIGGTVTAAWAGIPAPTPDDRIHLNSLGGGGFLFDQLAAWPTDGAPGGTTTLTLPGTLKPGWYELRLLSPDAPGLLTIIARSEPFRVGAFADLAVIGIDTVPVRPAPNEPVAVTVTVQNEGTEAAGGFLVDFYEHRTTPPAPGVSGDFRCSIPGLSPGAAVVCTGTAVYPTAGTFSMWAQVDGGKAVAESSEGNNSLGPRAITVGAGGPRFHRGDPNSSGAIDISDVIAIFGFLFLGNETLSCKESADANNDGEIDISDGAYLLSWLFTGGPEPPAPGPTGPCGPDPDPPGSPADLGCEAYAHCD